MPGEFPPWQVDPDNTRACAHTAAHAVRLVVVDSTHTVFVPAAVRRGPVRFVVRRNSMGGERAITRRMNIPAGARVYEVDCAQAWAELCRQFPVEVTAQKRHDWYRTTGRSGRWVVPDWPRLSELYEGVHLTVAGYLAAAGTAIAVDADTASVIAGWAPDDTYWPTDTVNLDSDDSRTWVCDTSGRHPSWVGETHR